MKTPEQLAMLDEITELLMQMNEKQLRKAALFTELFLKKGMSYADAVELIETEFQDT